MSRIAPLLALAVLLIAPGVGEAAAVDGCATGSAASASRALFGPGTDLVAKERVAGLQTALVLEPRVHPGTRHRVVKTGAGWCDATTAFNRTGLKDAAAASAYARLAAAPYFDGVTIRDLTSAGNVHTLTTHARTNGVVATWVITTDAGGVQAATWTATQFAQKPFVAQVEGLTALPDATNAYDRVAGGLLRARTALPTTRSAAPDDEPGVGVRHVGSDGFPIEIHLSDAPVAPQLGRDVGVFDVDVLRITQRAVAENYEEFLDWGLQRGWTPDDGGFVAINDALSAYCLACVLIADDFNIHMSSKALDALNALGYAYPGTDPEVAWSNVIGHEMFHNFQNRYVKPGPVTELLTRDTVGAFYSEGTARLQESLHRYGGISHQPESLVYAQDANGCNGFDGGGTIHVEGLTQSPDMDREMAKGVFTSSRSYATCFFWMPFYASYGWDGLRDLVTRTIPAAKAETEAFAEGMAGATGASGDGVLEQLQLFARSALTGRGNQWGAVLGGPVLDWSEHLEAWEPAPLERGGEHTETLKAGGLMANALPRAARVQLEGDDEAALEGVALFVVRDDGQGLRTKTVRAGRPVAGPKRGERVWVVAARAGDGTGDVTMTAR